jgi:hypothetical protein
MPKHQGEIVLANIRKQQRAELQQRTIINPAMEHIMYGPRLKSLIAEIDELDSALSERSEAVEKIAGEVAGQIQGIEEAIDEALRLVEALPEDDDDIVDAIVAEAEADDIGEEAAE